MLDEEDDNKNFYKLISPYILVIFLFNLIEGISIYETIYFVNELYLSLFIVSIIFGLSALVRFFVEIPSGILGDKIGNKFNIVFGAFCLFIGFLLILSGNIFGIILGMIFIGIGDAFWISSLNASAIEYIKYNGHYDLEKFFTIKNIVVSIGYLVGISINMFLIKYLGIKFIYYFAIGVSLIIFIVALLFIPKDKVKLKFSKLDYPKLNLFKENFLYSLKYIKKTQILFIIAISMLVLSIGIEGFYNFVYLYFNNLGIRQENIGFISYIDIFISFLVPFIGLWFFKNFRYIYSLIIFLLLAGLFLILFSLISDIKLNLFFYSLFFTFLQLYHLTKDILIHKNIEFNRNTIESSLNVLESIGEVIGGFVFGFLIYFIGFKYSFLTIALIFIIMSIYILKVVFNLTFNFSIQRFFYKLFNISRKIISFIF